MKKIITTVVLALIFSGTSFAQNVCTSYYMDVREIAKGMGWKATSEMGGGHNAHSKHYIGKAIDLSVRGKTEFDIIMLTTVLEGYGYIVRDERKRPKGQKIWNGSHMHLQVPNCK